MARRLVSVTETVRANRRWWDALAGDYHAEHGALLGEADFVWCSERLREEDARLLGDVRSCRVLEVGCGSAMCSRWLVEQGARPVATDLSSGMLAQGRASAERSKIHVPLVQADAEYLPFADQSFDIAFTAFGAVPFVADSARVMREVARVLRPGGRWVFSTTHPMRWRFPYDPVRTVVRRGCPIGTEPPTSSSMTTGRRPTSSTIARSATGCARSSRPDFGSSTSSSRSGRPA